MASPPSSKPPLSPIRWRPFLLFFLVALGAVLVSFLDLGVRARRAVRRAERLERWSRHPEERDAFLEAEYLKGVADVDRRRLSSAEKEMALDVLRKRREEARARPAAAEAYHAWRDVYELYAPPETAATRRARLMAAAARQRWREDWTSRRLPFDESLLDLEPGEEGGLRVVYSTPDGREASRAFSRLETLDLPAKVLPPDPARSPGDRALKLLVPEDRFWEAHEALRSLVEK